MENQPAATVTGKTIYFLVYRCLLLLFTL